MRQLISGLVAAVAVVAASAAPALACGGVSCVQPEVYVAPVTSCHSCGWGHERLPELATPYSPVTQYYYVNQGPTFTGPGNWAPVPTYQESAVSGWDAYRRRPYYQGYNGGRYADAMSHQYDGVGVEGPAIYSYRGHRNFRRSHYHHGHAHVLRRAY